MDRQGIIERFRSLGFSTDECWAQTGAAMVMYGMRERTHDIDMGCTSALAERVAASGVPYKTFDDGRKMFLIGDDVELSENWQGGTVTVIDGVPVVSPEDIIRCKETLNREKDHRDIAIIREWISKQK